MCPLGSPGSGKNPKTNSLKIYRATSRNGLIFECSINVEREKLQGALICRNRSGKFREQGIAVALYIDWLNE